MREVVQLVQLSKVVRKGLDKPHVHRDHGVGGGMHRRKGRETIDGRLVAHREQVLFAEPERVEGLK